MKKFKPDLVHISAWAYTKKSAAKNYVLICNTNLMITCDMNRIRTDF